MKIAIPQSRFLRQLSLVNHKNTFSWRDHPEKDAYILGDDYHPRSMTPVFELLGSKNFPLIPAEVQVAFSSLGVGKENLPIDGVQSDISMIACVEAAFKHAHESLSELQMTGYLDTFMECNRTLRRLQRARIDINSLKRGIESKEIKNVSVAKGFFPQKDGFLSLSEYSTTRTLTGRTTIVRGPQILTAPKLIRKYLTSSYQGGKIAQVDFVSLEPRVAMQLTADTLGPDVYEYLAEKLFVQKVSRAVVKKLVLCAVYGASESTLKKGLPDGINIQQLVEKTKEILNYELVVNEQSNNFQKNGTIQNFFGRIVEPQHARDSLLYNNYIQSTAVDVALLGFGKILDRASTRVRPIFFIHDAMLVDLHPDDIEEFKKVSSSIVIDGLGEFLLDFQLLG